VTILVVLDQIIQPSPLETMVDALPLPLPLLLGGLGVIALVVGVVVWLRRSPGGNRFVQLEPGATPVRQQVGMVQESTGSTPSSEPPAAASREVEEPEAGQFTPEETETTAAAKPMVVATFAPDQLSLRQAVAPMRRRPGATMKPFKEIAGAVVQKG